MKELYKLHLFDKHVLVNDTKVLPENPFEAVFAFANLFAIRIVKGQELASPQLIAYASIRLGKNVPQAFYKGFPKSVRKLSKNELLFDQLLHYTATYGFDNFDAPGYSVMEDNFKRTAFKEKALPKDFIIVSEQDAVQKLEELVKNLLSSTRPLSDSQYELVKTALEEFAFEMDKLPCKDTAMRLIVDTRNAKWAKFLHLSDFIQLVQTVNYHCNQSVKTKKLNLKNKERVLLSKALDVMLSAERLGERDCFEKQSLWQGYLHHLHYKPKTERAAAFLTAIRTEKNRSAYAAFEKKMAEGDIQGAVTQLINTKGTAAFMRQLNYILSRCETDEQIEFVISKVDTPNNLVVIQMLIQYYNYRSGGARTFKFPKFNRLRVHDETVEEVAKRKSVIPQATIEKIIAVLKQNLADNLRGKLGKVYVDKAMEKIALPIQENTSMGGFGTLPKGSKIDLPKGQKVRAFTYWEKVNDIDLSLIGLTDTFTQREFSWRTTYEKQSKAITFSGDQTSGYKGGSEYFDLDFTALKKKYPDCRYYVLCNNVFSGVPFQQCVCKAGFMMRDKKDSGEIFEPKTVATSFTVNCDSTFAYLFAIDVVERQVIWLNIARDSTAIVAGTTGLAFLLDYVNATKVINMHSFFAMLATELVQDAKEADVVVTDEQVEVKEGATVIRSYDTDKILPLLNA